MCNENPWHSQFLSPFLIFHSSEASPVARWLISKKSWQKYLTNYSSVWYLAHHLLPILASVIECRNLIGHLVKICIIVRGLIRIWLEWNTKFFNWLITTDWLWSVVILFSSKKWMPRFFLHKKMLRFFLIKGLTHLCSSSGIICYWSVTSIPLHAFHQGFRCSPAIVLTIHFWSKSSIKSSEEINTFLEMILRC